MILGAVLVDDAPTFSVVIPRRNPAMNQSDLGQENFTAEESHKGSNEQPGILPVSEEADTASLPAGFEDFKGEVLNYPLTSFETKQL